MKELKKMTTKKTKRIDYKRKLPDKYSSPLLKDLTRTQHYKERNKDMKAVFYWIS